MYLQTDVQVKTRDARGCIYAVVPRGTLLEIGKSGATAQVDGKTIRISTGDVEHYRKHGRLGESPPAVVVPQSGLLAEEQRRNAILEARIAELEQRQAEHEAAGDKKGAEDCEAAKQAAKGQKAKP